MKLKVKIIGHNVHEVGYRYFLMSNAIDLRSRRLQCPQPVSGEARGSNGHS